MSSKFSHARFYYWTGIIGVLVSFGTIVIMLQKNVECVTFKVNAIQCGNNAILIVGMFGVASLIFLISGVRGLRGDKKYLEKSHLICKSCETPHNVNDNFECCRGCGGELVPLEGFYSNKEKNTKIGEQ